MIHTPFALASLSVSNLRAVPDHASELVSQVMMGTPLKVLEFRDKFYQVETPEGYLGWLDAKGLELLGDEEMEAWKRSRRFFYCEISGLAYASPGDAAEVISDLVLGDLFEGEFFRDDFLKITLPGGRIGCIRRSECISFDDWINSVPDVEAILRFARRMMGFPYLWGGASTKASDCSGFTKLMFYTQGIILARDASQQAKYGEPVDITRVENLQPGDLLFFGANPERPGHVGIHLGGGDFIHSSGRVHISSVIPGDPKHDPNRIFVSARRIVTAPDTEGIATVLNHEWYR